MFTPKHVSHVRCHVSGIRCYVSRVRCLMYFFSTFFSLFFRQSGGASRWRACYQQGLARIVFSELLKYVEFCVCEHNIWQNWILSLTPASETHVELKIDVHIYLFSYIDKSYSQRKPINANYIIPKMLTMKESFTLDLKLSLKLLNTNNSFFINVYLPFFCPFLKSLQPWKIKHTPCL